MENALTFAPSFDFGAALRQLKAGRRVRRAGWNGKGMWLALTEGSEIRTGAVLRGAAEYLAEEIASLPEGDRRTMRIGAHIDMRAADGTLVIGWLASQTDMLAEDWEIVA
jgi:hypothetical protein